ncbi:MAG: UMP kinase [Lachnospiraceae bacterium]|nr:UMP kinase [Lachnospiraceae bacterium]
MSENYKRVLLKLSGEALAGEKKTGFDEKTCLEVAGQVKELVKSGTEVAIVIGGGNFWRGRTSETIDRFKADQIGMLATVMNCIYVSEIFRYSGLETEIFTQFECGDMSKLFSKDEAVEALKNKKVIFLAGGTGHPYFSTDTATALRAIELECDIILMARAIDGVYDSDPKTNPKAKKYASIPISEVVEKKLGIMDLASSVLCLENKMPLLIFSLNEKNSIIEAASGKSTGTVVTAE